MTDPTNPDRSAPELGGITEYDVTIPFFRSVPGGDPEDMHIVVRIPAADPEAAFQLGMRIAEHVGKNHTDPDGRLWSEVLPDITVADAETPSPAELAAELGHWRRVVAALAAKAPGLLMLTPQEYGTASPDAIVVTRVGDAMVFLPAALPDPAGGEQLPTVYGRHNDPDERRIPAHILAQATPGQIELPTGERWLRLDRAVIDHPTATVKVILAGQNFDVPADRMLMARPATIEGYGGGPQPAAPHRRRLGNHRRHQQHRSDAEHPRGGARLPRRPPWSIRAHR